MVDTAISWEQEHRLQKAPPLGPRASARSEAHSERSGGRGVSPLLLDGLTIEGVDPSPYEVDILPVVNWNIPILIRAQVKLIGFLQGRVDMKFKEKKKSPERGADKLVFSIHHIGLKREVKTPSVEAWQYQPDGKMVCRSGRLFDQ